MGERLYEEDFVRPESTIHPNVGNSVLKCAEWTESYSHQNERGGFLFP